jgi:hypothetical protein
MFRIPGMPARAYCGTSVPPSPVFSYSNRNCEALNQRGCYLFRDEWYVQFEVPAAMIMKRKKVKGKVAPVLN